MSALRFPLLAAATFLLAACGPKQTAENTEPEPADLTDAEKDAISAAKPFLTAIAARDYAAAYGQLSSHAKARMTLNQFVAPVEKSIAAANEKMAVINPSLPDFEKFLATAANEYGSPAKILSADQVETDAEILAGKGDALERAFTIGLMPESIPAAIRKAAIRAQVGVTLPPAQLKEIADREGLTVEELLKHEDFSPYFNLKVVLVEEDGHLRVGYFEITPASMWD